MRIITFSTVSTVSALFDRNQHYSLEPLLTRLMYQEFCKDRLIIQCSAHLLPVCIPSRDFPAAAHLHSRQCNSSLCGSIWLLFSKTSSFPSSMSFFPSTTISLQLNNHIEQRKLWHV